MAADINYTWVGLLILGTAILITWLTKCERKDEINFRKDIIKSEIKPDRHHGNKDSDITS